MEQLINALPSLLKKQQELDDFIMRERFLTHDETIEHRKLAFVVELAELAQEWRGFKYWSDNQQPSDKMLEEYVDVLHFALSLHNYYNGDTELVITALSGCLKTLKLNAQDESMAFINVMERSRSREWAEGVALLYVIAIGRILELNGDDILKEYDRKYQINIERQNNGY